MGSEKTYDAAIVIAAFASSLQKALDENAVLEAKLRQKEESIAHGDVQYHQLLGKYERVEAKLREARGLVAAILGANDA